MEEVIKRGTRQERWRAFLQAGFWTAQEFGQAWAAMTGEATIFTFLEEEPSDPLAVTGADLDARFLGALAGQSQPAPHPGLLVSRFRALGSVEEGKLVATCPRISTNFSGASPRQGARQWRGQEVGKVTPMVSWAG